MLYRTLLALALLLPTLAPAAPETQTRRFLLRMESNNKLAAYAVVDAYTKTEGEVYLFWQMTVTYFLAGRSGRADGMITRHYGGHIEHKAGPDHVDLKLSPYSVTLGLPTPGGDRAITLQGGPGADGKWNLSGSARFKGKGPETQWSVSSVRRIQVSNVDLQD